MRGFLEISQNKLPKRAFRARLPTIFTEKASKTIVSCDASSKFHRTSFQNERFAQGFRQFSQKKLPKRSFRAMLPRNFTEQASKTSVSHDASDNFHRKSFQNDRFVRCFLEISQNKLPKRSFRARLPRNFTEEARKINVSCEASSKFHRRSFQNDRFVQGFLQFSQNKLPKRTFRAMLPTIFTKKASKTIVSCDASSKFHRTSFQNKRFAQGFRQFSQKKLPKRSFRAMLPRNFTEQASKTSVSHKASDKFHRKSFQNERFVRCFLEISQNKASKKSVSREASSKFHRTSFQNERFVRGVLQISQNNASKTNVSRDASDNFHRKFAFRHSFVQSTHRILREGSSSKSKMCVSLQRRAIQNFKTYVLLQRGAQKRMNPAHDVRGNPRHTKITISPQFRTSDQHEVTRGLRGRAQNLHFTTVLDVR